MCQRQRQQWLRRGCTTSRKFRRSPNTPPCKPPNNRLLVIANILPFLRFISMTGTSVYGHLTGTVTSPLRSPWLSPKLFPIVKNTTLVNTITSIIRNTVSNPVQNWQNPSSPHRCYGQSRPSSHDRPPGRQGQRRRQLYEAKHFVCLHSDR